MGDSSDEQGTLLALLESAEAVLLDFDGPVCDLFGDTSTAPVAREIKAAVYSAWGRDLDQRVKECDDSHGILRRVREMYDGPEPLPDRLREALKLAEDIVQDQEFAAVASARRAPEVVPLVRALRKKGKRLAIVSNNAPDPVASYLSRLGVRGEFAAVIGRDPHNPLLMKPDPYSVNCAVKSLGLPPSACILIGDQLTDLDAAQAAGTPFIGYTQSPERAARMRDRGTNAVVSSHRPLISAAKMLRKPN
ncbi:HAD family hydrolase [Streptomyces sp. NPDC055013]